VLDGGMQPVRHGIGVCHESMIAALLQRCPSAVLQDTDCAGGDDAASQTLYRPLVVMCWLLMPDCCAVLCYTAGHRLCGW
jgi:hypothetical protein